MSKKPIPTYETKVFMGHVIQSDESGKKAITWDHPQYYQYEINRFNVGDEIAARMTNKKQLRSHAQNRYMHLYFSLISMSSGHTPKEIKNWAKGKILSEGITEIYGDKTRIVKDTSKLKLLEMIEFLEKIEQITSVPLPNPEPFNMPLTQDEWDSLKEEQKNKYMKFKPKLSTP